MSECQDRDQQKFDDYLRNCKGQFVKGNRGGPGNPFGRMVAALRQAAMECIAKDEICSLLRKMLERGLEGHVAAARLVLSYTIGKPRETVDPDQLNVQEWELFKQSAKMTEEVEEVTKSLEPDMVINMARTLRQETVLSGARRRADKSARVA